MSDGKNGQGQFAVDGRPGLGKQLVDSPEPPPLLGFNDEELQVYEYICHQLRGAGIEHLTAGMPIAIIVRTYVDWIKKREQCERDGWTQKAQSGWHSPTPWAEDEKRLKMELGQWLPKACLTIPSLVRVRKESGAQSGQDDLFGDLVQHATALPKPGLPN